MLWKHCTSWTSFVPSISKNRFLALSWTARVPAAPSAWLLFPQTSTWLTPGSDLLKVPLLSETFPDHFYPSLFPHWLLLSFSGPPTMWHCFRERLPTKGQPPKRRGLASLVLHGISEALEWCLVYRRGLSIHWMNDLGRAEVITLFTKKEIEAQKITQEVGWGHKLCVVEPGLEGTFEVLQQSHPHWFKPFSPQATCSRACAGEQEEKLLSPPGKSWQGHSNPWPVVTSGRELLAPRDRLVSPSKDAILPSSSLCPVPLLEDL